MRVHGLGGQGAVTLVTWLAKAAYACGKHVQAFPFFGAERRGAPVKAFMRLDDKPIDLRSQVYLPDLLVIMSGELTGLALQEGIAPDGEVLISAGAELAARLAERFQRDFNYIDATGIALDLGLEIEGMPMVNLPMFGAVASRGGIAPLETILGIVRDVAARRGNVDAYVSAAEQGFVGVQSTAGQAALKTDPDTVRAE